VEKELRSNIDDMLLDDYSDSNVESVLKQLGNPSNLAEEYRKLKRYLIPPYLYDEYIHVLKICTELYLAFLLIFQALNIFLNLSEYTSFIDILSVELLIDVIRNTITGIASVFFGVTVSFVLIYKTYESNDSTTKEEWHIKELRPIPTTKVISTIDIGFEMMFSAIFTYIICFKSDVIGIYDTNPIRLIEPLFSDKLTLYVPIFIMLFIAGIFNSIIKLKYGAWNNRLAWINCVYNIMFTLGVLSFLLNTEVYNQGFINHQLAMLESRSDFIGSLAMNGVGIASAIVVIVGIVDIYTGFKKSKTL